MANSDVFTVTTSWQKIIANGDAITNGDFSVFTQNSRRVGFIQSDVLPTKQNGDVWLEDDAKSHKFTLDAGEFLYAKSDTTDTDITVLS